MDLEPTWRCFETTKRKSVSLTFSSINAHGFGEFRGKMAKNERDNAHPFVQPGAETTELSIKKLQNCGRVTQKLLKINDWRETGRMIVRKNFFPSIFQKIDKKLKKKFLSSFFLTEFSNYFWKLLLFSSLLLEKKISQKNWGKKFFSWKIFKIGRFWREILDISALFQRNFLKLCRNVIWSTTMTILSDLFQNVHSLPTRYTSHPSALQEPLQMDEASGGFPNAMEGWNKILYREKDWKNVYLWP